MVFAAVAGGSLRSSVRYLFRQDRPGRLRRRRQDGHCRISPVDGHLVHLLQLGRLSALQCFRARRRRADTGGREWNLAGLHLALTEAISSELKLPANIDGVISGIISDMEIPWQYGRAFFIIPRAVGLAAHAVEETTRERPFRVVDMKDVAYEGPPERDLP